MWSQNDDIEVKKLILLMWRARGGGGGAVRDSKGRQHYTNFLLKVPGGTTHLPVQEMQETQVRSLGWRIPWSRKWQPTLGFLLGKFYGLRTLAGYSPWVHKESDT